MRRALAVLALLAAACDGPVRMLPDAGCSEPGTAPDQPALACPGEVDLGCIDSSGAPLDLTVTAATCNGRDATVVCSPAAGATVTPGTTEGRCVATAPSGASAECTFPIRYRVSGAPMIACAPAVTAACAGARTTVAVAPPSVMASCEGGAIGEPTSDAPAGGFPVGTTTVTYTASVEGAAPLSCTTGVTVEDHTPPSIDCTSAPRAVVRLSPDEPIAVGAPPASDACDDLVEVSVAPAPTTRGAHTLTATATDEAGLSSTCEWTLTVYDAFAPRGLRVVSASLAADGSTDVTLGWEPSESADVTHVRLERADSDAGPWAELEMLDASVTTYTDAAMPSPRAYYRLVAVAGAHEGGATPPLRALAIDDGEYHLRDQSVSGVPFATSLFGVVRHPIDLTGGPFPLVVFLHGNHGNCRPASGEDECETRTAHECTEAGFTTTPNAHGYVYLQETLSALGYVTVSLSANALNCRDDYIPQRTQLILEHLRRWAAWNGGGAGPFGATFTGRLDLSRVALVGHSRGGEAVASAPAALRATPIAGVSLASVFAIGPTDYHDPTPSGVPFAVLLPGCDADVRTLEGLFQYDRGLDPSDPNLRAQVLYVGANHNFFNSEWRYDDNASIVRVCSSGNLVGGPAQRGMLEMVLTDWIEANAASAPLPSYARAEGDTPALLSAWAGRPIDLRWSYASAMRRVIDDFTGGATPDANDLGGANTYAGFIASLTCTGTCARNYPHPRGAIRFAWQDAAASAVFHLSDLDASGWDALSMRFASRIATINDGLAEHEFAVRVSDTSGRSAEVPISSVGRVAHRYPSSVEREILSTVRVPLAFLRGTVPSLDLAHLETVELVMPVSGGNTQGSIWMADLDLAGE